VQETKVDSLERLMMMTFSTRLWLVQYSRTIKRVKNGNPKWNRLRFVYPCLLSQISFISTTH